MSAVPTADGAKALRMVALFFVGLCALTAIVLLGVLGRRLASNELQSPLQILTELAWAVFAMTIAFWILVRLLRHDGEQTARGRKVAHGARSPGLFAAAGVAIQCLTLALALMAAFEISAQMLGSNEPPNEASSGAEALERARREAAEEGGSSGEDEQNDGSDLRSPAAMAQRGLLSPAGVSGEPNGASGSMGDLLSDEPTLRVWTAGPPTVPSVHLRGFVLDRYGRDGILHERSGPLQPLAAGSDGWIDVESSHASRTDRSRPETPLELGIEFLRYSNGIVFAPAQLQAVLCPRLSFDSGLELWRMPDGEDPDYSVQSKVPAWSLEYLSTKRARRSVEGDWLTGLPPTERKSDRYYALRTLGDFARALTQGCSTDLESVLAIVSHLREQFGYELYDTSFLSPERCVELLQRGSGSCSHFASLAAVMLRTRGIPTRIAVGYVAREPLEKGDGWLVRSRDGHAWIEVHFEGLGWLPFDATPGDVTAGGAVMGWAPVSDSERVLAAWTGRTLQIDPARTSALGEWVAGAALDGARKGLDWLTRVLRVFLDSTWIRWAVLGAAMAGAVLFYLRRLKKSEPEVPADHRPDRRRRDSSPAASPGPSLPPLPEARALMEALEGRNLSQAAAQTPSHFARGVEQRHPESRGLLRAFRALMGRASTSAPLSAPQTQELVEIAERLRNEPD